MTTKPTPIEDHRFNWMSEFSTGRKLLILLTPVLLLVVALTQIVRAYSLDQSPWKGGGFGMFATVDSPGNREIRAYLVSDDIEIEIPIHYNFIIDESGDVMNDVTLARTVPTDANLRLVAGQLAEYTWYFSDKESLLPQVMEAARELQDVKPGEPVVLTMASLREIENKLNGVTDEKIDAIEELEETIEEAPADPEAPLVAEKPEADGEEEEEEIRIDPPRGFGPGMYDKIVADIQKAIDEGQAEEANLTEFQEQHNDQNKLKFSEIRVELWKGEFEGKTTTYTFRLQKTKLASAAGDNLDICLDCQP